MGFRDYNPDRNTFLTRDAYNGALADLGLAVDPWTGSRYAFAGGNPISRVEIDGHCATDEGVLVGCGALDPEVRYEREQQVHQQWQQQQAAKSEAEKTLRDGDGVRCPDGEKRCKPVAGASDVKQRMRDEAARAVKEIVTRKGDSLGGPPKNVEQFLAFLLNEITSGEFNSISVCLGVSGGLLADAFDSEVCENIDVYGLTHSAEHKEGFLYGVDLSANVKIKISSDQANEISTKIQNTTTRAGVFGLGPHFGVEFEHDRDDPSGKSIEVTMGTGVGLHFGGEWTTVAKWNSTYRKRW